MKLAKKKPTEIGANTEEQLQIDLAKLSAWRAKMEKEKTKCPAIHQQMK